MQPPSINHLSQSTSHQNNCSKRRPCKTTASLHIGATMTHLDAWTGLDVFLMILQARCADIWPCSLVVCLFPLGVILMLGLIDIKLSTAVELP